MKIVEQSDDSQMISLNNIPVGSVFRGEIFSIVLQQYYPKGIFYKAFGPSHSDKGVTDVVVVRLDSQTVADEKGKAYANLFTKCAQVRNYELLDVELVIKRAK